MSATRLPTGGAIDRGETLRFSFDGRSFEGFEGDTLASALLANGVTVVGRSFKYHRPRGIVSIGSDEPNALVQVGAGAFREPNTRATSIALYNRLIALSQNRFPSLRFDVLGINNVLSPLLGAGFYYKTFKWPASFWPIYEQFIRRAAGLGMPTELPDPAQYDERWHHCDVLVVGAGPAGVSAALTVAKAGARVLLADENRSPGGSLNFERLHSDNFALIAWVKDAIGELCELPNVRVLTRTTVFGYYDHNFLAALQRLAEPGQDRSNAQQRLWRIRTKRVILATGALERPAVFPNNDRPGVMLASAVRGYVNRFAVLPGRRVVVTTNNDTAYRTAFDLADVGAEVAVADVRTSVSEQIELAAKERGVQLLPGHAIVDTSGRFGVTNVTLCNLSTRRRFRRECDLVASSGGWSAAVHLHAQAGGTLRFEDALASFVPDRARQAHCSVGAANGDFQLGQAIDTAVHFAAKTAEYLGLQSPKLDPPRARSPQEGVSVARWRLPSELARSKKAFVDLQNDVTVADIEQAASEGYVSVEHLKRYTTLGMGTDQGKTSNVNGLAILAAERGAPIDAVGTTTFRPPYTPVTLSALAVHRTGGDLLPVRRSPLFDEFTSSGAVFTTSALWRRPRFIPRAGETLFDASVREARGVRRSVGITDVSTLGKIEISGAGAARFLDWIYTSPPSSLRVGRARYAVMLREDGFVFDDGTIWRLAADRFLVTTSTVHAEQVLQHLELHRDTVFHGHDIDIANVTEQWAAIAVAGPKSRDLLSKMGGTPVDDASLPFMGVTTGVLAGHPVRIARISYSGERAFEIYTRASLGPALLQAAMTAGACYDVVLYGLEALEILRIEKGHVGVGTEIDGRTTPYDLGLAGLLKGERFVGKALLNRPALHDPMRLQLVGLTSLSHAPILEGAQLIRADAPKVPSRIAGHVTSAAFSVALDQPIALALVANGRARLGEELIAADPVRSRRAAVRVVEPTFFDPSGGHLRG